MLKAGFHKNLYHDGLKGKAPDYVLGEYDQLKSLKYRQFKRIKKA